ncbi:TIGR00725 family protein [candidate division KSB1 bacterium]|nr:TIGR00725 family protein [candidate division KSB1 bacterium]NIR68701.1 TIGR00725 family protein [candidate division KSB1 bacterium]NIS25518.1 TIGR00725 family protein [candidate division KSB1 bacterium]NIT72411.1 TIGR00725 family protein [candidate division KSB1 bacterium]NIU26195.1 TIGR00725 family protein [candidate division KSB1 bacterium]
MLTNKMIGVIGGGQCSPEIAKLAEEVGERIAQNDGLLICGGLSGVMEAACKGAKKQHGTTIGILPGDRTSDANDYVDIAIATGLGEARNVIIVKSSDAVIAINGEYGTLSEISFCLKLGKPVIGLKTWNFDPGIIDAKDATQALNKVMELVR